MWGKRLWKGLVLVLVPAFVSMVAISVLARPLPDTTFAVALDPGETVAVRYLPYLMDVPSIKGYKVSAVLVTYDAEQWHAFANRTMPFGCTVEPHDDGRRLVELCGYAIYDLSGSRVAGPGRTLYRYPVRVTGPDQLEVDLSHPEPVAGSLR